MRLKVKKRGTSAAVRIPASIMASSSLPIDQRVDVRDDQGRIIIEPAAAPSYDLDTLLDRMTADTFLDVVDFDAAVGNEIW